MANPAGGRGTERVNISKAGVRVGTRPGLNLLEGANVTIMVSDNASDDMLDVTLAAAAASGVTDHSQLTGVTATQHHTNANDHAQSHGNTDHTTTGTPGNSAVGDVAAQGSSPSVTRLDHAHGREAFGTTTAAVGTSAGGSATTPSKSDHVHATGAGTPSTSALADAAAIGTGPAGAMTDHKHARESSGTTAAAIGTSAGGSATTPSKSDHVHATGAGTPSTQNFSDAAAIGTGPAASMTDHKHAMPANPVPAFAAPAVTTPAALSAAGAAATIPHSDHAHQSPGAIATITAEVNLNTSVTETTITTATLPTNFLFAGTTFRITLRGTVQVQATSGILTFRVYLGANVSTETYVMATQTGAAGPVGFFLDTTATVRSTGASGTYVSHGWGQINFATPVILTTTTATTATVDTTAATPVVKATAQWATSSATNILKVETATIEVVKM